MSEIEYSNEEEYSSLRGRKWIVRLLGLCTILAAILWFTWKPEPEVSLTTAAELDEMIRQTLENFPVAARRVQIQTVAIDSLTSRRVYTISVPQEFSQTHWHYELDRTVRPYRVETPARVIFPERDLHIYLIYNDNIVRTLRLQTISEPD